MARNRRFVVAPLLGPRRLTSEEMQEKIKLLEAEGIEATPERCEKIQEDFIKKQTKELDRKKREQKEKTKKVAQEFGFTKVN